MNLLLKFFLVLILIALVSCSGSSGGSSSAPVDDNGDEEFIIRGIVNKGIVINANVNAYVGDKTVAHTTTNDQGRYQLSISGNYRGRFIEVRVTAKNVDTDGEYSEMVCDIPYYYDPDGVVDSEKYFGDIFRIKSDFKMSSFAYVENEAEVFASVTPLTHLVVHRTSALGGLSTSNINQAVSELIEILNLSDNFDVLAYVPDITDVSLRQESSDDEIDYAITNSAFLQFSNDLDVSYMTLIDAMTQDFTEDGVLGFGSITDMVDIDKFGQKKEYLYNNLPILSGTQIFHYSFNEQNSAQCRNSVGNYLHGQIYNALRVNGISGGALEFQGGSSFALSPVINTEGIPFDNNLFYADTWINLKNGSDLSGTIMGDTFGGVCSFRWFIEDGYIKLYVCNSGEVITSNQSLQSGQWYHLAVTYDGQWARLFINGEEDQANEVLFSFNSSHNVIRIGDSLVGMLDEVRLFNYDMNDQEIKAYYQQVISGIGSEPIVVNPTIEPKNNVIHYTFDESQSTTVINIADTGHDGLVNMGRRGSGKIGQAIFFDTPDGSVEIPVCCSNSDEDIELPLDEFTISTWVNFDQSINTGNHSLFGNSHYGMKSFDLVYNNGLLKLTFFAPYSDANHTTSFNLNFDTDSWHHLAIVYNALSIIIYIDGIEAGRQPITFSLQKVVNNLYIGHDGYSSGFIGGVDDFRFYDKALSGTEILQLVDISN